MVQNKLALLWDGGMVKLVFQMTKESKLSGGPSREELSKHFNADVDEGQLDNVVVDSFVIEHPQVAEAAVRQELSQIKRKRKKVK